MGSVVPTLRVPNLASKSTSSSLSLVVVFNVVGGWVVDDPKISFSISKGIVKPTVVVNIGVDVVDNVETGLVSCVLLGVVACVVLGVVNSVGVVVVRDAVIVPSLFSFIFIVVGSDELLVISVSSI